MLGLVGRFVRPCYHTVTLDFPAGAYSVIAAAVLHRCSAADTTVDGLVAYGCEWSTTFGLRLTAIALATENNGLLTARFVRVRLGLERSAAFAVEVRSVV